MFNVIGLSETKWNRAPRLLFQNQSDCNNAERLIICWEERQYFATLTRLQSISRFLLHNFLKHRLNNSFRLWFVGKPIFYHQLLIGRQDHVQPYSPGHILCIRVRLMQRKSLGLWCTTLRIINGLALRKVEKLEHNIIQTH